MGVWDPNEIPGGVYIYRGWGVVWTDFEKWESDVQIIEYKRRTGLLNVRGGSGGGGVGRCPIPELLDIPVII